MIEIRLAQTPHELTQITRLRYAVYVEELGAAMQYADHQRREVRDPWDATAYNLGAWRDSELVGCVRLNCAPETDLSEYAVHCQFARLRAALPNQPLRLSAASKLAVLKSERGSRLALQLTQATYEQMYLNRICLNFITCQSSLTRFYQRLGWHICGVPFSHQEATLLTPLALVVQDREYLQRIQSPFLAICQRFPVDQPRATALRQWLESGQPTLNPTAPVEAAQVETLELCV